MRIHQRIHADFAGFLDVQPVLFAFLLKEGFVEQMNPEFIQSSIAIIVGSLFIVLGIVTLIEYFKNQTHDSFLFAISVVTIISGIVIMSYSTFILSACRIIIAIWVIFNGIMNMHTSIVYRQNIGKFWIASLILAIATIAAGIIILLNTGTIMQIIGISIIVYAIADIIGNLILIKNTNDLK